MSFRFSHSGASAIDLEGCANSFLNEVGRFSSFLNDRCSISPSFAHGVCFCEFDTVSIDIDVFINFDKVPIQIQLMV